MNPNPALHAARQAGEAPAKRTYNLWYAGGVAFVASAGGFLFGYDLALIAGALPYLKREFALSPAMEGLLASSGVLGAAIGPLLGLMFADLIGRRRTMMLSAIAFLATTVGCALAPTVTQLIFWRIVGGMGVGLAMISCPIYIAELSPAPWRGPLVNVIQLVNVIGINLAVLISYWVGDYAHGWRIVFASQGVPVAVLILGLLMVPESPRWLAAKGHTKRALDVLTRINGKKHAQQELDDIMVDVKSSASGLAEVFQPYCRKPLLLAIILMVFSQVNGVNMLLLYAPTILNDAGISFGSHAVLAAVPTYLMILLATFVSFPVIHRYTRRGLLIFSTLGMGASHLLMASLLALHAPAISLLAPMMCGAFAFTLGLAPLSWIIVSEIFPNRVRSHALAIVCVFLFGSSFVTAQIFPIAKSWLVQTTGSSAGMYLVFATVCFSCVVFVWRMLPETKGVSLDTLTAYWRTRQASGAADA